MVIRHPFYLGKYPVTVAQFRRFVVATGYRTDAEKQWGGRICQFESQQAVWRADLSWKNPGFPPSDRDSVVAVSRDDAQRFVDWLKQAEPTQRYRLPTEAEREYAHPGRHKNDICLRQQPWF